MAYSLFVDSSDNLTLGLLDDDLVWLEFKRFPNKKSSGVFHGLVEELLSSHGKKIFDLDRVFYSAGPGSYTGVRLVEGFCQILRWRGVKTNSFYLFEIPLLLKMNKGAWISEAYKGEFFVHLWNNSETSNNLIKKEEVNDFIKDYDLVVSSARIDGVETTSILDIVRDDSQIFFKKIVDMDLNRDPFYYRSIDKEFTKPKPFREKN